MLGITMEKLNFVKDGVIKLPPGFRFQPTDEEIVFQYLTRKIISFPLPASIIPEITLCTYDPWDLPGDVEQDRYFFSKKEAKYPNGNRTNRATGAGYWKATGLDKRIICSRRKQIMGLKKTLVFYKGKHPHGSRTNWVMHEYRLVHSANAASSSHHTKHSTQNSLIHIGNWVLCHIFLKKRSTKTEKENIQTFKDERVESGGVAQPMFSDYMMRNSTDLGPTTTNPSSSSSSSSSFSSSFSDSSVITEVSSLLDYEETSGHKV